MRSSALPSGPRTLFVCLSLPTADESGLALRALETVEALNRLGPLAVFGVAAKASSDPPAGGIEIWRSSSGAGLGALTGIGGDGLRWLRERDGHPSDRWYSSAVEAELVATTRSFRPDLVVVGSVWLRRYLPALRRLGIPTILSTDNVEAELQEDLLQTLDRRGPFFVTLQLRTAIVEAEAVSAVDQVWVCSERDARVMRQRYRTCAPVAVVPNTVHVASYGPPASSPDTAVLFPADFGYQPNAAAAQVLVDQIVPRLFGLEGAATLTLMGRNPTTSMRDAAAADRRIVVTGPVPNARPYLSVASVMMVPLYAGGGTRFKILEGFAARLPVISTAVGIAGLAARPGQHFLRAETPDEFVSQALRLHRDPVLRAEIVDRAHDLVQARYSWDVAAATVHRAVSLLLADSR